MRVVKVVQGPEDLARLGNSGEDAMSDDLMASERGADEPQDVDMFEAMKAKVLAGEPIYIGGPLESPTGAVYLRLIERLRAATGRAVTMVFH